MIRNLKALGLALVAVFAMSAMAAGAAQAEKAEFAAPSYPTTVKATGENVQRFKVSALPELTCIGEGGGVASVHGEGILEEHSPTLTAENVTYTVCHVVVFGITFPATVDFNTCDYDFTAGTLTGTGSVGSVDIPCQEEGDSITITVYDNGSHTTDRCVIHVGEQTPSGNVVYTNLGGGGVTADAQNVQVEATVTDTNKLGCNSHVTDPEATYNGAFVTDVGSVT